MTKILISFIFFLLSPFLQSKDIILENIRIADNFKENSSRIVLDLSHKVPYSVFILNNKPRLVIDLEVEKYKNINNDPTKLIKNIRIRKTEKSVLRIVFDLNQNAFILKNFYLDKSTNRFFRLVVDIKKTNKPITKERKKKK